MKGSDLVGFLVTYVDDLLVLSDKLTAEGLHAWLVSEGGWETDGLSEATPGSPIRFLGMQLSAYEDGHFSLDQESYIDELVRSYNLPESAKSKVVCPRELVMAECDAPQAYDEGTIRAAQKIAGECLWLRNVQEQTSPSRLRSCVRRCPRTLMGQSRWGNGCCPTYSTPRTTSCISVQISRPPL